MSSGPESTPPRSEKPARPTLADFVHRSPIQTRWEDNDPYGHINNIVYYSYFDTVINAWLVHEGGLEIEKGGAIGLMVESHCEFIASAAYPEALTAGLRVARLGNSSVRYEVGIFRGETLCAFGYNVHVFVDRTTRRPVALSGRLRDCLQRLVPGTAASPETVVQSVSTPEH